MLVIESGRFIAYPVGGQAVELDLDGALDQLGGDLPRGVRVGDPRPPTAIPVDLAGVTVHRAQVTTAIAGGGAAFAYLDSDDRWVRLGPDHLRVLALGPEPASAQQIGAVLSEPGRPCDVLADLESLALVRIEVAASRPEREPEPTVASEPAIPDEPALYTNRLRRLTRGILSRWTAPQQAAPPAAGPVAAAPAQATPGATPGAAVSEPPEQDGPVLDPQPPIRPGTVPVWSFWSTADGPPVGAAAVVAYARVWDGGRLNDRYDLRRMDTPAAVVAEVAAHPGPGILLCGNYDWSLAANLAVVERARQQRPDLLVIHGGPSTPSGATDSEPFLRALDGLHVAVAGEGELTFVELLDNLSFDPDGRASLDGLDEVEGLRYLRQDGSFVDTGSRTRHDTLADFPSPLLSGELDRVPLDELNIIALETNRGCPYSCTFCDWGAATMSRIRQFPIERVHGEMEWLAERGVEVWYVSDANFGIVARDVEIAEMIGRFRTETGHPRQVIVFPAKNSTERYLQIMDSFIAAGIAMKAALALQTRNAETLAAVRRSNIKTSSYDHLAAESRRRGLPLLTELMVGLPGSTVDSFKEDLQWGIDRQVRAFIYPTVVLPNSPMNDPAYREELEIRMVDGRIVSTSSFTAADRRRMDQLTHAFHCLEVFGTLRHVLRYLQWDHGRRAIDMIEAILDVVTVRAEAYPLLAFHLAQFENVLMPPVGWRPFFEEAERLLVDELGVTPDSGLRTALDVTRHLLVWPGRTYPSTIELDHDYVSYFRSAQASLIETGEPGRPDRPLGDHGPGLLEVDGDPLDVTALLGLWEGGIDGDPFQQALDFEVQSPLQAYRTSVGDHLPPTLDVVGAADGR
ncbi:MAG: hypothetical protein JWM47_3790 [Acidimicrobiales bacterium]|nr:hypothetical protein [Acidimicrobiales bacterium]